LVLKIKPYRQFGFKKMVGCVVLSIFASFNCLNGWSGNCKPGESPLFLSDQLCNLQQYVGAFRSSCQYKSIMYHLFWERFTTVRIGVQCDDPSTPVIPYCSASAKQTLFKTLQPIFLFFVLQPFSFNSATKFFSTPANELTSTSAIELSLTLKRIDLYICNRVVINPETN